MATFIFNTGIRIAALREVAIRCLPLALLAALLVLSGCKSGYQASARNQAAAQEARKVQTATVESVPMERAVVVTGTLAAYDQAIVGPKVPGRVKSIAVDLGTVVHKGQVVAQIEQQDYEYRRQQAEAALAQARARLGLTAEGTDIRVDIEETGTVKQARALLDEARLNLNRIEALFKKGVISRAQLDEAEANHKVAISKYQDAIEEIRNRQALLMQRKSELDLARQQLSDTTVIAPFDGIVQEKRTAVGEYLAAGAPIATVVKVDPLRLRAEVPEREARKIIVGQEVRVSVEGDSNSYTGRIARLSPIITAQSRILVVEAEVRNNGQLKPGSFARGEIVTDPGDKAVAIPANALVTFAGIEKIITIQDGKAVEKPVTTGRRNGQWVEVLAGINAGEKVVVDPGNLQSGQPVTVE